MENQYNYVTKLDIRFGHQELIDINRIVKDCEHQWFNETLTKVNDSVVRIGIVKGEFHWHKHDNDEFFYVIEGKLIIEIEGRDNIELNPGQGVTISKGLMHRPLAPVKTVMLMVEIANINPTGDS
ncbi:MAG: cupin domain-containing protein [Candidatus Kapaibacterium sp.]